MKHFLILALAWARHVMLLRTFSVLSLLILTAIAPLLAWRLQGVIERIALKKEATLAQGQAQALLRADLLPQSASARLTTKPLRGLALYNRHNMYYGLFAQGYYLSRLIPAADLARWSRFLPRLLEKAS